MKNIEDAMCRQGRSDEPERVLESDKSRGEKHCSDSTLDQQCVPRPAHYSKEDVIRRNDHHDRGIERAIAIEPNDRAHATYREREQCTYQIRQCVLPSVEDCLKLSR